MKSTHEPSAFQAGKPAGKSAGDSLKAYSPNWSEHLPGIWRDAVEAPLYFKRYSEYEISAERALGYDADERPCFTSHRFMLTSLASDDDEEFYEVVTYSEEMAAWRLRDERWLVYRLIATNNCNLPRGFYVLSPDMPR